MRSLRLPWGAPSSLLVWAALLLLTYPLGALVPHRVGKGGLNGPQFSRYQNAELQCRLKYGIAMGVASDEPAQTFASLAVEGKLPGAARRVLILRGSRKALEPEILSILPESERTLWKAIYTGAGTVPADAEARLRALRIGFLSERAVADAVARRDGAEAGQAASARFDEKARASVNRLLAMLGSQFLVVILGLGLLAWTIATYVGRPGVVVAGVLALTVVGALTAYFNASGPAGAFAAFVVGFGGLLLLIPAGIASSGRGHWLPASDAAPGNEGNAGHWLDGFVFYMMAYRLVGLGIALAAAQSIPALGMAQIGSGALAIGYVGWRARQRGASLADLGLRGGPADPFFGALGFAQNVPMVLLMGAVAQRVFAGNTDTSPNPMIPLLTSTAGVDRLWLVAMAVVAAPVLEEFFFRGALYSALRERYGFVYSALGSSAVFAALHPIQDWLPILTLGVGFAWLRERRRSLVPGMVAHALQNGMASALASLLGS